MDTAVQVSAFEEPVTKLINFRRSGETVSIEVTESHHDDILFRFSADFRSVVTTFWRALRRLQSDPNFSQWRYPFPAKEMDQLTQVVSGLKAQAV